MSELKKIVLAVSFSIFLVYISVVFPFLIFGLFLSIIPLVILILKEEFLNACISYIIVFGLLAIAFPVPLVLIYIFMFGAFGIGFAVILKKRYSPFRTIRFSIVLFFLIFIVLVIMLKLVANINILDSVRSLLERVRYEAIAVYEKWSVKEDLLREFELQWENFALIFERLFISIVTIVAIVGIWICYLVCSKVFPHYNLSIASLPEFSNWRPKEEAIWGLILAGGFFLLGSYRGWVFFERVGLNLAVVFLAMYLLAGISLIVFFLNFFRIRIFFRALLYLLIILQPLIFSGFGIIDVWLNWRQKIINRQAGK